MAETSKDAEAAFDAFMAAYELKYDKAAECLAKDRQALLAFYDFPAEHWKHLRTRTRSRAPSPPCGTAQSDRRAASRIRRRSPWCSSRCGAEKLAQARWPQPVAQAHSRCQVHRRDRSRHQIGVLSVPNRRRLNPQAVTKIWR